MEAPLLARMYRIVGLGTLALVALLITLYSLVSAYVEASLLNIVDLPLNPPAPGGLVLVNVYSGIATSPITGLVDRGILSKLEGVGGVITWVEVTTPALVNGNPVVVRGVDERWVDIYKPEVVEGEGFQVGALSKAWVGVNAARRLGVKPGDLIVVKSLFTNVEALLIVAGVLDTPQPYRYEVLVPLSIAYSLRGSTDPSVVRVAYDPSMVDEGRLAELLGSKEVIPAGVSRVVSALAYKGYVRVEDPSVAQRYYVERLGVPYEVVVVTALVSNVIVSLLNIVPAWLIFSLRRRSLRVLVEQGVTPNAIRLSLAIMTIPLVTLASLAGLLAIRLLEPPTILGYPIDLELPANLALAHILVQVILYTLGLLSGDTSEG